MSASSTRRRNSGNGENQSSGKKPLRSVTPLPISASLQKSSSSKENPKPGHRPPSFGSTQKPLLRQVPRIDKSAAARGVGVGDGGEGRVTRSKSSGSRGRSSSPSDLIRVFSDSRKRNETRVVGEKVESDQGKSCDRVCEELSSGVVKSSNLEGSTSVVRNSVSDPKADALLGLGEKAEKVVKGSGGALRRKSIDNAGKAMEGSSNVATTKYQSKLHEKLAFLEGKVKKIASDIKKTKDMLDLNNQDSSQGMMLSDLHQKISGIEKSMVHVVDEGKHKTTKAKASVKGLNKEELEDRLFPHQRLLRSRTQSKTVAKVQGFGESSSKAVNVEVKPSGLVEENPIALEFLASLDKEKGALGSGENVLENLEVQEMDTEEASKENNPSKDVNLTSNLAEILRADEDLEEIDEEEKRDEMELEEMENECMYQLNDIGSKTSTGGWFVSEGEAVILAHDDGSCSYYDVANSEVLMLSFS